MSSNKDWLNEALLREEEDKEYIGQNRNRGVLAAVQSQAEEYLCADEEYRLEAAKYWEKRQEEDSLPYYLTEEYHRMEHESEKMLEMIQDEEYELRRYKAKREKFFKLAYLLDKVVPLQYLTKTKPAVKWNNVHELHIAKKTDEIGDTTLNGSLHEGVFLLARSPLPTQSPYGDTMMLIPAKDIIKPDMHLYYTGFYCFKEDGPHYVVLLLSRNEIEGLSDEKINIQNNNILVVKNGGIFVNNRFWVEIFFTENVKLQTRDTRAVMKLHRAANGTPANILCNFCNAEETPELDHLIEQKKEAEACCFIEEHEKAMEQENYYNDYQEPPEYSPEIYYEF